ncbi:hypothetical protein P9B03_02530 [Metasolibacillus meyeri]|uniref:Uncharacterized protein n=1 Tax=Metasolibacillus meyeri TaxID=1071052 RepID=A0AAW9NR65_9BACL|nr:hypothetical protein [Metasolibacillus meyeri]MEC1177348.1 hypothetical protein [Metasolibacillus meyeri]
MKKIDLLVFSLLFIHSSFTNERSFYQEIEEAITEAEMHFG